MKYEPNALDSERSSKVYINDSCLDCKNEFSAKVTLPAVEELVLVKGTFSPDVVISEKLYL